MLDYEVVYAALSWGLSIGLFVGGMLLAFVACCIVIIVLVIVVMWFADQIF